MGTFNAVAPSVLDAPITEALVFCSKPVACIRSHSLPLTSLGIAAPLEFRYLYNHHIQVYSLNYPSPPTEMLFFPPQKKFFIFILQPCRILTIMLLSSFPSSRSISSAVYTLSFLPPTCSSSKI